MSSPGTLCQYTRQEFLSTQNLTFADEAVSSVFGMMLGLPVETGESAAPPITDPLERTAVVGFSGSMRGSCEIRLNAAGARLVASAMLGGTPIEEGDESIDDAVGELCNMIAGGWKNRIDSLAATCSLSPPTVISGCDYKVHMSSSSTKLPRTYSFEGNTLRLTLHCLEPRFSAFQGQSS